MINIRESILEIFIDNVGYHVGRLHDAGCTKPHMTSRKLMNSIISAVRF